MKLVASTILKNEIGRYLAPWLDHLVEFCDEIRILDDHSDDGTLELLASYAEVDDRIQVSSLEGEGMFGHEGRARNALLDWTLDSENITHVLAIDADEFVSDGQSLRASIADAANAEALRLGMIEVWGADEMGIQVRQDGGWREKQAAYVWKVPPGRTAHGTRWQIPEVALASGRVPRHVNVTRRVASGHADLLHFGWACRADREERHARYVLHDGGRYHQKAHLDSIMWGDDRVTVVPRSWPESLPVTVREEILLRVRKEPVPVLRDTVAYDVEADTLYFSVYDPPVEATTTIDGDAGIVYRYRENEGLVEFVGATWEGFRTVMVQRGIEAPLLATSDVVEVDSKS